MYVLGVDPGNRACAMVIAWSEPADPCGTFDLVDWECHFLKPKEIKKLTPHAVIMKAQKDFLWAKRAWDKDIGDKQKKPLVGIEWPEAGYGSMVPAVGYTYILYHLFHRWAGSRRVRLLNPSTHRSYLKYNSGIDITMREDWHHRGRRKRVTQELVDAIFIQNAKRDIKHPCTPHRKWGTGDWKNSKEAQNRYEHVADACSVAIYTAGTYEGTPISTKPVRG